MFNFQKRFSVVMQLDSMDCGVACLKMVAKHYGKDISLHYLKEKTHLSRLGVSFSDISDAAQMLHFKTLAVKASIEDLCQNNFYPFIAHWREIHFVVVHEVIKRKANYFFKVADPGIGLVEYTQEEFLAGWTNKGKANGYVLLLQPSAQFYQPNPDESDLLKEEDFSFSFFLPYLKRHSKQIAQIFMGVFITTVISFIFPFLSQSLIDNGINQRNIEFIRTILMVQVILFCFQLFIEVIREKLVLHTATQVNLWIKSDFLNKLLKLPISFFDSTNFGDISQRLDDHERVQEFISLGSVSALFSCINITVFGVIFALFDPFIFFIYLLGTVLYVVWTMLFLKKKEILDQKAFTQMAFAQSTVQQIINGIQEIKLNGSENRRRYDLEKNTAQMAKINLRNQYIQHLQLKGGGIINEFKNMFIIFVAAGAVVNNGLTLGMLISIQYIVGQLNIPVNNLINFIITSHRTKLSFQRINEIHTKPNEDNDLEGTDIQLYPKSGDITLKNVSFRYGGKSSPLVLKDLSITIPENKVTAIVGASGSGKTTLMKLLLKFYKVTEGKIQVNDFNINHCGSAYWRTLCGSVMQDGYIFDDTILRNITESRSNEPLDRERLLMAVKMSNMEEFIELLPGGYNTKIGASGLTLSGGQKQRILIARAIYKSPKYLFFDEATSSLDATNEKEIVDNLNRFFINKTVLIIAHRLSTVKNADNIIVLDKGQLLEQGTHQQLIERKGAYYSLVKNQLELDA
jgi:ATP-binding cassette, subfamily B, bacterial